MTNGNNAFLEEQLKLSGWQGGRPTTEEGQAFILDYLEKTGVAPTPQQLGQWKAGQDYKTFTFTPESTMGKLGWGGSTTEDYTRAQRYGGWYGPQAGEYVPEGGMVVTDKTGRPIMRLAESNPAVRSYVSRGQYVPREGMEFSIESLLGEEEPPGVYPHAEPFQPYQMPTLEEGLAKVPPEDLYSARLQDYLNQKVKTDQLAINQIYRQKEALDLQDANLRQRLLEEESKAVGEDATPAYIKQVKQYMDDFLADWQLTYDRSILDLDNMLAELMDRDKASEIVAQSEYILGRGTMEGLPLMEEIADLMGPTVYEIYNRLLREDWGVYQGERAKYMRSRPPGGPIEPGVQYGR